MHGLCSPPPPYRSSGGHVCRSWPTQCPSPMLLTLHRLRTKGALLIGLSWPQPEELGHQGGHIQELLLGMCPSQPKPPALSFQSGWVVFSSLLLFMRLTGPSKVWPTVISS